MKNRNINNISLPLNLILKINIVRMLIIWDTIAKYIYRILLLLLLFSILTLTEVFSHLNYWLHGALLITFSLCLLVALINFIYRKDRVRIWLINYQFWFFLLYILIFHQKTIFFQLIYLWDLNLQYFFHLYIQLRLHYFHKNL